ncbi:aminoglycoside 3-N-acetyltransferase [Bacillus mesophilus]|uniref:aminoglycoside N(3)-acetyltransferase n=1 Tax=Bacillus mesophilus TaxID=1808955 RepID=UPI003084432D|nr:aminoglycoside 3-N-acetyltransferase [Bacillus mesophilus]
MSEKKSIERIPSPNTATSLQEDFRKLGIERGMVLIVHSSLSSLGWVCGGPVAVVDALMKTVGEEGTIVMPTQTSGNSDPAGWQNPPVPEEWWSTIREEMPAYNSKFSPSRGMGQIVETFRTMPGVKRSQHPAYSFAAWGKYADYILAEQPLESGFGPDSPLGKIYQLDGSILLLGVSHDSNTSLHMAEHSIQDRKRVAKGAALIEDGQRVWKTYEEIEYDADIFENIGKQFEETNPLKVATIGLATCKLMKQRQIVDFAREYFNKGVQIN